MSELSHFLAAIGVMLLAGALSNKLSSRFNVPILILFLLFGGIIGYNYSPTLASFNGVNILGTVAMSFILFSGGMDTRYRNIRDVLLPGGILATVGVLMTAFWLGIGAWYIAPEVLILPEPSGAVVQVDKWKLFSVAMLLGAMISSTDAAAVFAILSGKSVGLKGKLRPLLELESGSNDPMAYFLTVFMVDILLGKSSFGLGTFFSLIYRMAGGVLFGWAAGRLAKMLFRIKLEYEGLYFVFNVAIVLATYGITEILQANGMMACYVCGVTMSHFCFNYQKSVTRFSDGVSWLMQVALFTSLGLFVDVSILPSLLFKGVLLALLLMFVARPLSVMLCMPPQWFSWRERIFVSWVGLRGAAPIVLATFPLACFGAAPGEPAARTLFNLIFIMVIVSLIVQGTTLMPLARRLKLDRPDVSRERSPLELERTSISHGNTMFEFVVNPDSDLDGKTLAELQMPSALLVTMIRRKDRIVQPRGATTLQAGDGVTIMGNHQELAAFAEKHFPDQYSELGNNPDRENNLKLNELLKLSPRRRKKDNA